IYTYYMISESTTNVHKMIFEKDSNMTIIKYEKPEGSEVVYLSNGNVPLSASYFDRSGKKYLWSNFDYKKRQLELFGKFRKKYTISDRLIEQNGAFFYLMKFRNPKQGKKIVINLIQSKIGRNIEMNYSCEGTEVILIGDKKTEALKFKMSLHSSLARIFWPYDYYYWYRKSDGLFLKYSGPDENKKNNVIVLSKLSE
ncbi:MAG: hypothetical protein D6707_10165, partial [Bacteroidetes bacterium]